MRVVCKILILLVLVAVARGQQTSKGTFSDTDKTAIIESILDLELRNQNSVPDFANIRDVSSENIEFVEPPQVSKHGFMLVAAADLRQSTKDRIVTYLLFRNISLREGVAVVILSRVTEGRPCFGAPLSIKRTYTYEARQSSGVWVAHLTARPVPSVPFVVKRSTVTR
jgi:hypothetical protein